MRTRRAFAARAHAGGFSLIEMSIVLAIAGTFAVVMWRLLPLMQAEGLDAARPAAQLRAAEHAVVGFALLHGRLPCPDSTGDGLEDCAAGAQDGWLPVRTLGHLSPSRLRYGINRVAGGLDLGITAVRHTPQLPDSTWTHAANGLDLCVALRTAGLGSGGVSAGGVSVAFAIAHPGGDDRDNNGSAFDGGNDTGPTFVSPNAAQHAGYDDHVRAIGFNQLAMRLDCPTRLAAAHGATRTAWADYDHLRFAQGYAGIGDKASLCDVASPTAPVVTCTAPGSPAEISCGTVSADPPEAIELGFQSFAVRVREMNRRVAVANQVVSAADLLIAIATGVSASSVALSSAGSAAPAIVGATLAITAATAATVVAANNLVSANNDLAKAKVSCGAAVDYRDAAAAMAAESLQRAKNIHSRGLL